MKKIKYALLVLSALKSLIAMEPGDDELFYKVERKHCAKEEIPNCSFSCPFPQFQEGLAKETWDLIYMYYIKKEELGYKEQEEFYNKQIKKGEGLTEEFKRKLDEMRISSYENYKRAPKKFDQWVIGLSQANKFFHKITENKVSEIKENIIKSCNNFEVWQSNRKYIFDGKNTKFNFNNNTLQVLKNALESRKYYQVQEMHLIKCLEINELSALSGLEIELLVVAFCNISDLFPLVSMKQLKHVRLLSTLVPEEHMRDFSKLAPGRDIIYHDPLLKGEPTYRYYQGKKYRPGRSPGIPWEEDPDQRLESEKEHLREEEIRLEEKGYYGNKILLITGGVVVAAFVGTWFLWKMKKS